MKAGAGSVPAAEMRGVADGEPLALPKMREESPARGGRQVREVQEGEVNALPCLPEAACLESNQAPLRLCGLRRAAGRLLLQRL